MSYLLACKDMGIKCAFIAVGDTPQQAIQQFNRHLKKEHYFTENQFDDILFRKAEENTIKTTSYPNGANQN